MRVCYDTAGDMLTTAKSDAARDVGTLSLSGGDNVTRDGSISLDCGIGLTSTGSILSTRGCGVMASSGTIMWRMLRMVRSS